ncbi:hypothetical protein ACFQOZ_03220 [Comamonas endophytica]|uniref:hypothetical protein n=1 Tax=Comamonas endophytica TaxID=2949090 RepID=UPI00360E0A25
MFHVYCAIAYLFIVARVIAPLPIRLHWKLLAAAALLPGALYQFWSRVFFGNMYAPELPFPVVALLGWTFGSFVLLLVFTIVGEILEVLYRLAARRWSHPPRGTARRVASVVLAFALGAMASSRQRACPKSTAWTWPSRTCRQSSKGSGWCS